MQTSHLLNISMLTLSLYLNVLAFSSNKCCVQVQPHRAVSMSCLKIMVFTDDTSIVWSIKFFEATILVSSESVFLSHDTWTWTDYFNSEYKNIVHRIDCMHLFKFRTWDQNICLLWVSYKLSEKAQNNDYVHVCKRWTLSDQRSERSYLNPDAVLY